MIKVGLTGGIGSGKTFLANIFSHLGIPVYYADNRAKLLYTTNQELKSAMIAEFGNQVYLPTNKINKNFLRKIIFSNPESKEKINKIVHPFVTTDFEKWCHQQKNAPYVLKESALLFETGLFRLLNKTILVTSSEELKIKRIKSRDNLSDNEIQKQIAAQLPDTEKEKFANYIIINDEKKLLLPQVLTIHQQLKNIS